jgi:Rrf2 family protein
VEQILLRLRRAGLIHSTRGARGGYALARAAGEISVRDVIQASELTTFDLHCVSHPVDDERCAASHACSIRPVWLLLQQKIDAVLESVSLADLMYAEPEVRERVGLPVLQD